MSEIVKCSKCSAEVKTNELVQISGNLFACPVCKRGNPRTSFKEVKHGAQEAVTEETKSTENVAGITLDDYKEHMKTVACKYCNSTGKFDTCIVDDKASIICSSCGLINHQDTDDCMLTFRGTTLWSMLKKATPNKAAADDPAMVRSLIETICDDIKQMLLDKNRKYGNSALSPLRCFSKADAIEGIKVRLDDKLSRLHNEQGDEDEDVIQDIMGYLVLLKIAKIINK